MVSHGRSTTRSGSGAPLEPAGYARGHRLFEARSDQRGLIVDWLLEQLAPRAAADALSVLSVGCGDGSVDAPLAAACAGPGRRWTGVDPHAPSVAAFTARLEALPRPPEVTGLTCTYAELPPGPTYDVVTFVHSLYYVADLDATLADALTRLAPGGELLVLHAPLGELNRLTAAFAAPVGGHPQPWDVDVEASLSLLPAEVQRTELSAFVDLTGARGADPALLDFVAQTRLAPDEREAVLDQLEQMALPGPGCRVRHPVTAYRVARR